MWEFIFDTIENYVSELWLIILLVFLLLLWISGGYLMYKMSRKDDKLDVVSQKKQRQLMWVIGGLFILFILMLYIGIMPFITLGIMFSNL